MALELHRARFIEWTPASVVALAPTPDGAAVALGRDDGSIELYDVAAEWRCLLRVPGCEGASLTALAWYTPDGCAPPRLLSASLSGQIVAWDLQAMRPLSATDSNGGPVWHMSMRPHKDGEPQRLAVACDDGCLRLFGASDSGVAYQRAFTRVEARLLSTAWHPDRVTVVVGSSDGCVRCWDSRSGAELLRVTLARGVATAVPPCVWVVLVLPDGTLASGDSEGRTCLWDGTHGALLQAVTAHEADVLALACTPAGDALFSAGVDSKVALLGRTGAAWGLLGYKRAHTHDVRALAVAPFPPSPAEAGETEACPVARAASMLLSAGTDAQLLAYAAEDFLEEHPVRVVRSPAGPALSLATARGCEPPLLLCTHATWLDLWRLGSSDAAAHVQLPGAALELAAAPAHLARIRVRCKRNLLCSAVSANGEYVAASDAFAPHLFAVAQPAGRRLRVSKRALPDSAPPAVSMAFTSDNLHLVLAAPSGAVHLLALSPDGASCVFRSHLTVGPEPPAQLSARLVLPPVTHVVVSPDMQWLAVAVAAQHQGPFRGAARTSCVCIFSLEAQRAHAVLPMPADGDVASPVAALAFAPAGDKLLAVTASKEVHVFDLESGARAWTETGLGAALPERLRQMPGHLRALSMDPVAGLSAVLLHTQHALCHVDLARPLTAALGPPQKRRRINGHAGAAGVDAAGSSNGRVVPLEQPCLFAAYFRPGAALLVERPWAEIVRALPAPLLRKRFGA